MNSLEMLRAKKGKTNLVGTTTGEQALMKCEPFRRKLTERDRGEGLDGLKWTTRKQRTSAKVGGGGVASFEKKRRCVKKNMLHHASQGKGGGGLRVSHKTRQGIFASAGSPGAL